MRAEQALEKPVKRDLVEAKQSGEKCESWGSSFHLPTVANQPSKPCLPLLILSLKPFEQDCLRLGCVNCGAIERWVNLRPSVIRIAHLIEVLNCNIISSCPYLIQSISADVDFFEPLNKCFPAYQLISWGEGQLINQIIASHLSFQTFSACKSKHCYALCM